VANRHFCAGTGIGVWRIDVKPTNTQWWKDDKFIVSFLRGPDKNPHSSGYKLTIDERNNMKDDCLGWEKHISKFVDEMGSDVSQDEGSHMMIKLQYIA
jgi:hypothetical protein